MKILFFLKLILHFNTKVLKIFFIFLITTHNTSHNVAKNISSNYDSEIEYKKIIFLKLIFHEHTVYLFIIQKFSKYFSFF